MKGRKPDPRSLRLLDGAGEGVSTQDPPAKGAKDRRPACPGWFSEDQRTAFASICRRLDREGLLASADEADIRALAIAEADLKAVTEFLTDNGTTYVQEIAGKPHKCPGCKGTGERTASAAASAAAPTPQPPRRSGAGRPCSICTHPEALAIAGALAEGDTPGAISRAFRVGRDAVVRHRTSHLAVAGMVAAGATVCPACNGTGVHEGKPRRIRVRFPEVKDKKDWIDRVKSLSAELGLSPTSRVRVKGKMGGQPISGLQEFLKTHANRA